MTERGKMAKDMERITFNGKPLVWDSEHVELRKADNSGPATPEDVRRFMSHPAASGIVSDPAGVACSSYGPLAPRLLAELRAAGYRHRAARQGSE